MKWLLALCCALAGARAQVVFDASAPDRLRVSAATYEVAIAKANGAILGITDKAAGAVLTAGSRNGCLWGSQSQPAPLVYRGGCNYSPSGTAAFAYSWDAGSTTLTLRYTPDPQAAKGVTALATLTARPDHFDLQLTLTNHMGGIMQSVMFPSDLVFSAKTVDGAYYPFFLPGARLKPAFFAAHRSISSVYPGARAFADYLAVDAAGGRLAWYGVNRGQLAPATLAFTDDEKSAPGTFYASHTFQTWIADGATYTTPVVRVRVGQNPQQTVEAYREENGIGEFPGIQQKLGVRFAEIAAAPLIKVDFRAVNLPFREVAARLGRIRAPAILHPVAYWPRLFDQNYPDFLPPAPEFGSTADFESLVEAAHARGMFVMPYTNPTWWDAQSPTVRAAGDVATLAVLKQDGTALWETYGANTGIAVSPHVCAVQERLASLMAQWRGEAVVDFVFQDQIGSRGWLRDFQPAAPDPQSYSSTWLEFTREYGGQKLMTEDGWDRLAATETGFAGSLLNGATAWNAPETRWGKGSRGNATFGEGNWEPYPIGVWLFHDKVIFYHHDLSHPAMNAGLEVLTWNSAFGISGGYLWPELRGADPNWVAMASAFQPAVWARAAGRRLASYRALAPDVTESRFDDLSVIANWSAEKSYETDGYTIAPSGCLARVADGALLAGAFLIEGGVHVLVAEGNRQRISVSQPLGQDAQVAVPLPARWAAVTARALTAEGAAIGAVPVRISGGKAVFTWARAVNGQTAGSYELTPPAEARPTRRRR